MPDPVLTAQWESGGAWLALGTPRNVNIRRGRTRALDKIGPGTMVLELPNSNRQNDPAHNPFFAALRPGVRVRLRATYGGTTYDLFTGYLERIRQHFGNAGEPRTASITYEVVDGLSILAATDIKSGYESDVRAMGPKSWLRLGEKILPWFYDRIGSSHGYGVGNLKLGVQGNIVEDEDTAVEFPNDRQSYFVTWPDFLPSTFPMSLSFLLTWSGYPPGDQYIVYDNRGYNFGLGIYVNPAAEIHVTLHNAAGALVASCWRASYISGTYLFTVVLEPGQPIKLYSGQGATPFSNVSSGVVPGVWPITPGYHIWGLNDGAVITLDEILVWNRALSTTDRYNLWQSAVGWIGDTVLRRIERILAIVKWDPANVDIGDVDEDGQTLWIFKPEAALDHLQKLAGTIEGRIWVKPDGALKVLGRSDHLKAPYSASAATLTDQPGGLGYRDIDAYGEDWSMLANIVRRSTGDRGVAGETVTSVSDAASIAAYGTRDRSPAADVESLYYTTAKDHDLAMFRLAHYKDPTPYIDNLKLQPRANEALWPVVLGLDLGRRITFRRTPQGVGAPIIHPTIIEGIQHSIGPKKWLTTYSIDAVDAQLYFRFDDTLWDSPDWRFSA